MSLTLSKRIPARSARTKTITAKWCTKNFTTMSDRYRAIRGKLRHPGFECYWCGYQFVNGDPIALAHFEHMANKVLCETCAVELLGADKS